MLNLNILRRRVHKVTVAGYLTLKGLDPAIERKDGKWDTEKHHNRLELIAYPSLAIVPNETFDSGVIVRVDQLPADHVRTPPSPASSEGKILQELPQGLSDRWHATLLKDAYNS